MSDRNGRLLRMLAAIPSDSALAPVWQSASPAGFLYLTGVQDMSEVDALEDLETLASGGYLERTFVERLSLCPHCTSHALNVHESCPQCESSNLSSFKALFHFRCGYVGPAGSFKLESSGFRCPKCNRILGDLGTDHDSPGEYFECRACSAKFQTPNVGARCLACGARFSGDEETGHRDVFVYRLTARGKTALKENRLLEALEPA